MKLKKYILEPSFRKGGAEKYGKEVKCRISKDEITN